MRFFLLPTKFLKQSPVAFDVLASDYHEQLAKITTCVKYSIDAYHRDFLPRYILPFCFGNLNPRDYHGDSLSVMFPRFSNFFLPFPLVFSACFSRCFYGFLRCFSCFPALFPLFPILDFASKKKIISKSNTIYEYFEKNVY